MFNDKTMQQMARMVRDKEIQVLRKVREGGKQWGGREEQERTEGGAGGRGGGKGKGGQHGGGQEEDSIMLD